MSMLKVENYSRNSAYLIEPASFRKRNPYLPPDQNKAREVSAVRLGRQYGQGFVAFGTLWGYCGSDTVEEFIERYDTGRHGLDTRAKLFEDGTLWTAGTVTPNEAALWEERLKPFIGLGVNDELPEGWDGWYDIRDVKK